MQFWSRDRRRVWTVRMIAAAIAVIVAATAVYAQRGRGFGGRGGRGGYRQARFSTLADVDSGSFQFCRIVFRTVQGGDGGDWSVDWPRADENLSIRLSELTKTPVSGMDTIGDPNPL